MKPTGPPLSHPTGCAICGGEGWVCEEHPLTPWECECGAPGIPCKCNPTEKMPPGFRTICSVDDEDSADGELEPPLN